ncbi:hypothetical protein ABEI05_05595 [Erwinia billingiae]|uniref:hypothetical protein n=1 Tax=Erwinia billingiae TaxID=182337 RepID=UPI003207CC2E
MAWHHSDYINLISSLGGLGSAFFAAYATYQARKSVELSKKSLDESSRQSEMSRLMDELIRLSERGNSCIGDDSFVIEKLEKLVELVTACFYAENAINVSGIGESDKEILRDMFVRNLRPGIIGEIERGHALFNTKGALSNDVLREMYRDAQKFLKSDNPIHIPDPVVV